MIGFAENHDGNVCAVLVQPYIADARLATKEEKMCWWMMKAIYFSLTLLFILQILAATTNTAVFRQGQANNLVV